MSLPACFVAAADPSSSCPILVVDLQTYLPWLEAQEPARRAWLEAHAFAPVLGAWLMLPDASGRPQCVLAAIVDPGDPLALAHLPMLLPIGLYHVDPASPVRVDPALILLGWGLGAYRFDRYVAPLRAAARLRLHDDGAVDSESFALLQASLQVRDLVNTPTEHMGPAELEDAVRQLATTHGATFRVTTGDELLANNFPTIHAVGRASHRAPRLIEMHWGQAGYPHVAIVGKGVCFDSGGLDIKAADGMRNMKKDMGGAAHAIALARLVMTLKLPLRITLLVPAVENAISANAFRPGEVIRTRLGLSVEVDNTDAEGRLVLCDALAYAAEQKPDLLMDFATLTGAARVALGPDLPALFCNDEALALAYQQAGERTRDRVWRLPLWRPYLVYLKSTIADLANAGPSRMAGAITAAVYLERFVPEAQPWTHVDVYSWNDTERPGRPIGGEAQGLRAAFALLRERYP